MRDKTPDQIRCETVPVKHNGIVFGLLGTMLGFVVWFGGWAVLHREQVRKYPQYCAAAIRSNMGGGSVFVSQAHSPARRAAGMTTDQLRYALLRYGNLDHRYDGEIIRHGWYPRDVSPVTWVARHGGIAPVYDGEGAANVLKWPTVLTAFTLLVSAGWGMASDQRYRMALIAGIQLDGSIVATVDGYHREVKGDGMRYRVKKWEDR